VKRYWRYSQKNMQKLYEQGRIIQTKPGNVPSYKRYLDEMPGVELQDIWNDIKSLQSTSKEKLGYPTQKPLELLERIIEASSNPGDVVLDPFCGCGTTIAAAQKLDRGWIGIDITHLAIALQKYRLQEMFPSIAFKIIGEPESIGGAEQLANDDRFQFEWWALSLIKARPTGAKKGSKQGAKGADQGIDGIITFIDDETHKPKRIVVQVKSGHVKRGDIATLKGDVEREKAAMGVFVTLEEPTGPMEKEAATAGFYHSPGWDKDYPKIQLLTIEDLLDDAEVKMPPTGMTFKQAQKVKDDGPEQGTLFND